jgi:transcriptional regulator with XRE-family HTH domain
MSSIGERVKQRRTALKMSQSSVAKAAGGLAYQTIQDLENGPSKSSKHLVAIARALKVDPHWLETGEGAMEPGEGNGAAPAPARVKGFWRGSNCPLRPHAARCAGLWIGCLRQR